MPELPEVESVRRTLTPLAVSQTIRAVRIHNPALRWPWPHSSTSQSDGLWGDYRMNPYRKRT